MEEQNTPTEPTQSPSPTPTPQPASQKSSKLTVILALLLTAIIAALLTYYFTQQYYQDGANNSETPTPEIETDDGQANDDTSDSSEDKDSKDEATTPTANLLLARLERTIGMDANPNSLQLHIVTQKFPSGEGIELANITANYIGYKAIYADGDYIYYITLSTQLGRYNLSTGKNEIINIPGVDNVNDGYAKSFSLTDFAFDNGKILYMKGECVEVAKCTVGLYDIATKKNTIVLEDIMKNIDPVFLNVTHIESFDASTGKAVITDSGGDAGYGTSVYYELDVNTGKITKTDTTEFFACGDDPEMMMGPCGPEEEAANAHHNEVMAEQFTMCGDVKVKTDEYWVVTIEGGDETEVIDDASFVSCR